MSSAAAASWTTRNAARYARGQCSRKSASIAEADPRCAARTEARSSRPAAMHRLYDRGRARGPCSRADDEARVVRRAGDLELVQLRAAGAEGAQRSLGEGRRENPARPLL